MAKRSSGELSELQLAFARIKAADPTKSDTEAAIEAGYNKSSAYQSGYLNMKNYEVVKKIEELKKPHQKRVEKRLNLTADYVYDVLHNLIETCRDSNSKHFDPSAVNQSVGHLMKALGMNTDKIQLDANVNNHHSIDMVRILEADTSSQEAFSLLMERKRSKQLVSADGD